MMYDTTNQLYGQPGQGSNPGAQRLALANMLMQQPSQQGSPISQLANKALGAYMMYQGRQQNQPPFQLGNAVPQSALQNANQSQDPLGALTATQGWTPGTP